MRKKYKIGMTLIAILIILVSIIGLSKLFLKKDKESKPKIETKIISNIEKYGYTLDERDTKYMKDTFKELESILIKIADIDLSIKTGKVDKYTALELFILDVCE